MTQPAPDALAKQATTYEALLKIRASKTCTLKPTPMLRTEITDLAGRKVPFRLRYYQVQGIMHLLMLKRMVLGDGTGLGKCLTGDTLLTTDQGLMPIQELAPLGEMVEDTFYEPRVPVQVWTGREMTPVRRFYWNGIVPTLRVTTRNGFRVEGSFAHPVCVRDADGEGFKKLPDVEAAMDYVCIDRSKAPFPESEPSIPVRQDLHHNAKQFTYLPYLTPNLARLLGYVVAEAWTNGKYATNISQHANVNPESHADIRKLLLDVFGWEGNNGCASQDTLISVNSIGIRQYLEACGVTYTTARFKEVPWCILRGTDLSVREFLRGLFESEASVAEGGVEFTSSSEKLVRTVQVLLLRFGIVSTLSPKYVEGYDHTYWRLTFFGDGARTFSEDIGFVSTRKNDALDVSLKAESNNPNKDVVPYMGLTVAALKEAILGASSKTGSNDERRGSGLKQYGESFQSTLKHVIHGKRNATYRFLRQLLEVASGYGLNGHPAFKDIESVVRLHYFYDPVVQIDEGRAPLMDIEVEHHDHCFSGNGLINHNTIEMLGALCYLWERETENRVIVVTPKSALRQWGSEIARFTTGIKVFTVAGKLDERKAIWEAWANYKGPDKPLLIVNYHLLIRDWDYGAKVGTDAKGKPDPKKVTPGLLDALTRKLENLVVIYDEATAFKNSSTKTWQTCRYLSERSQRCYGLTATLLKNNLMEGFGIYKAIYPTMPGQGFRNKTAFMNAYCVTKLQPVAGGRKVPIVVGYRNLQDFRNTIDPHFLGRPKHAVSDELPTLITKEIVCPLSDAEHAKYQEALTGVLELGDGEVKDFEEHKAFVSLIYCQQVVNSLTLLKFEGGDEVLAGIYKDEGHKVKELGTKESTLLDLLTEELDGEKTIVYTRFASLVPRLQEILAQNKIKSVAITGKQNDKQRQHAQETFQDTESDTKVIFITDAGSEAINLQAASAMIFYDAPWSWGNYVQLLGRPIRIGSPHQHVVVYHLVSERPGDTVKERRTIDRYVLDMLEKKKDLIDKVIGEAAVGALEFEKDTSTTRTLIRKMQGKD